MENELDASAYAQQLKYAQSLLKDWWQEDDSQKVLGWRSGTHAQLDWQLIQQKAKEVQQCADVLVIIGVGGSNQATRAMLEAIPRQSNLEIIYLGNTLSPLYMKQQLQRLEGKSVYVNIIAKNFQTLEPGSHCRVVYQWLRQHYDLTEVARRMIATGTPNSSLHDIARSQGWTFLAFPEDVGGRYSAFTAVTYFPIACAGLDIQRYHQGIQAAVALYRHASEDTFALSYAVTRYMLYQKGFHVELMATFEPSLYYFMRWWWQLFGESEGKQQTGIFPSVATYTEDLHSIGQYVQEGTRLLQQTFVKVENLQDDLVFPERDTVMDFDDGFDYLNDKTFHEMNQIAQQATIEAHINGGVPCHICTFSQLDEYSFGYWYYTFMIACVVSCRLFGVNPFDQEGVEEYKQRMFRCLKNRKED